MTSPRKINYDEYPYTQEIFVMPAEWRNGDLLTTPEVAEILDVTPAWVSELCRQGRVPGAVRRGRFWFVPYEAIENIEDVKMGRPPKTDDKTA